MSWKKNAFSYLMWFIYTIAAGVILTGTVCAACMREGTSVYWGVLFVVLAFLGAGGTVLLLHRVGGKLVSSVNGKKAAPLILETVLVLALLTAGVILRAERVGEAVSESVYYEAAKVAAGQRIPQIVHGAVYLYVQILHAAFMLLGNNIMVGLWIQIVLQLSAFLLLFFAVRRTLGAITALVMLGFCACGPYMADMALVLSPEILFLFIFSVGMILLSAGLSGGGKPFVFFLAGVLSAFCAYLDIMGIMLLFLTIAAVFSERKTSFTPKASAVVFSLSGCGIGFVAAVCMDAFLSAKSVGGVLKAWWDLYCPGELEFALSRTGGYEMEKFLLAVLLVPGVFSFWCDRHRERLSVCTAAGCMMVTAAGFGIFTDEMPVSLYLYLLCAVLAGMGIGQCINMPERAQKAIAEKAETEPQQETVEDIGLSYITEEREETEKSEKKQTRFLDNPLPLPKRHERRVLDYPEHVKNTVFENDDYDYPVSQEDDFDI